MAGGDGYRIDSDELRGASDGIDQAAQAIGEAWTRFAGLVQGMGDIFGDDMVGGLIGASHGAAFGIVDDSIVKAVEVLQGSSGNLAIMAAAYDKAEYENISTVNRAGS